MIEQVAVIVPAADEEDRIIACLETIERARRHLLERNPSVERVDVIVVLDACRDQTPARVARFAARHDVQTVTSTARRVGAARQQGALRAIAAPVKTDRLWLASTDADSTVPSDWLTSMVAAADTGVALVLGTVLPGADLPRALRTTWLAQHQLQDGHPHIHGANLGLRADTYLALGGWRADLARNEDVDLAARAVSAGVTILRTAQIPVITSARMTGQAPGGFSSYLRYLRDHRSREVYRPRPAG